MTNLTGELRGRKKKGCMELEDRSLMLVIRGGNCSIAMTTWDVKKKTKEVEREREGKN